MKPTFIKKNTEGSAAGHSWEAGEVKALHPTLAEQLVILSPEDYEVVQEGEQSPEPPAHNSPGFDFPSISSNGESVEFHFPTTTNIEVPVGEETIEEDQATLEETAESAEEPPVTPVKPTKAHPTARKSNKTTETPSAE